jgi:MFS transporter, SP family, galactose:H+ symporter
MTAELYPNRLRAIGASSATAANWSANLLITVTFLTAVDAVGKDVVFWIYAAFAAVGIVFVRFFVPETKGRSLEEIDDYWTHGQSWQNGDGRGNGRQSARPGCQSARAGRSSVST